MNREMKDSGIPWTGEIPKGWQVNMLSSLFDEHKQKNKDLAETNLLSLSYGKIVRKDINTKEGLLPESFDGYNVISRGDIVFRLTDLQNDKRSLRTGLCLEKGIITSAYVTIRERTPLNSSYFHYLLHSYDLCKVFYGMGDGVRQGMNYSDLRKLLVLQPSLAEQQKIAEFLDRKCSEIDEMVALQEKVIEELKAYKQSVITEVVTKGLTPNTPMRDSGIEWIGSIPEHWEVTKFYRICSVITDFVASGSFESLRINVPYLDYPDYAMLVRTVDLSGKGRTAEKVYISKHSYDFLSNSNLFGGEIILPNIGASVGDVYIVPNLYERMSLAPNSIMFKTKQCDRYWYYYFYSEAGKQSIFDICQSTAQPKFNKTELRDIRVCVPTKNEQQAIADYLDEKCADIDSLIQTKQSKIDSLKEYKKSIIYEYVTGKREVE